ncbi:hypothetical protein pdam_00000405 [Pocillopora damicornis]|uniref:RING-type E3 ubiquitin transferase n=2 Tax=Pocillopora TaxID=46730 RepID=A0A3M6UJP5_POCDA|nr:TNF receptor-associated factor 4-like isoform X1 [Pocillopora damicornis]RMX53779.1 hypothetical protein pdam_00000405 [Pocillopora damicornis]CAH3110825.1 unnamed protein product [Pocillopora meandrina]
MPGYRAYFVPAVRENLLCRICHLPVRNAVQVSVCGHRFCDSCLNGAFSNTRQAARLRCPVDSSSIDLSQIYADDVTNQMIFSLNVVCDHYQLGCKWKGQLKKLEDHMANCKYAQVDCIAGCGQKVQRRKITEHVKKDCIKRWVKCPRCKKETTFENLQSHNCPAARRNPDQEIVTCSNGCGVRLKRHEMPHHLRNDCLHRWVYCENCSVEIVFKDKQEHLRRCRRSDSQTEEPGITRGGKRQSMPHSVRFDPRGLRSGNRSNSTSQEALNSSPPAPMRSASFPAFLNYVGREEIPSEVVYRGSERSRSRTTSQIDIERESDIFTCTCGQRISRGQITSHMSEECPRRLTKCQYCRAQVKFEDMQSHLQVCPHFPLSCPNSCGVSQIPREEVDRHLTHECRSNLIHCPFKHVGCQHQCPQRSLTQHLEDGMKKHLELVSQLALDQRKEIDQLREIVKHCKPFTDSKLYWRIDDFWNKFEDAKHKTNVELHSPPFYTSPYGYKFKIVVFPYGNGSGEGSHLSLYVRLLPGEYDTLLKWPFEGEITLSLLDQNRDSTRGQRNISQSFSPDPNWKSFQRPGKNGATLGFGYPQFVSHRGLESTSYVKEDCLFIKATIDCKYSADL